MNKQFLKKLELILKKIKIKWKRMKNFEKKNWKKF